MVDEHDALFDPWRNYDSEHGPVHLVAGCLSKQSCFDGHDITGVEDEIIASKIHPWTQVSAALFNCSLPEVTSLQEMVRKSPKRAQVSSMWVLPAIESSSNIWYDYIYIYVYSIYIYITYFIFQSLSRESSWEQPTCYTYTRTKTPSAVSGLRWWGDFFFPDSQSELVLVEWCHLPNMFFCHSVTSLPVCKRVSWDATYLYLQLGAVRCHETVEGCHRAMPQPRQPS